MDKMIVSLCSKIQICLSVINSFNTMLGVAPGFRLLHKVSTNFAVKNGIDDILMSIL